MKDYVKWNIAILDVLCILLISGVLNAQGFSSGSFFIDQGLFNYTHINITKNNSTMFLDTTSGAKFEIFLTNYTNLRLWQEGINSGVGFNQKGILKRIVTNSTVGNYVINISAGNYILIFYDEYCDNNVSGQTPLSPGSWSTFYINPNCTISYTLTVPSQMNFTTSSAMNTSPSTAPTAIVNTTTTSLTTTIDSTAAPPSDMPPENTSAVAAMPSPPGASSVLPLVEIALVASLAAVVYAGRRKN